MPESFSSPPSRGNTPKKVVISNWCSGSAKQKQFRRDEDAEEKLRLKYGTKMSIIIKRQIEKATKEIGKVLRGIILVAVEDDFSFIRYSFWRTEENEQRICAWLYILALDLNYPVVWCGDNETYLTRIFGGGSNSARCLFVDVPKWPAFWSTVCWFAATIWKTAPCSACSVIFNRRKR